MSMKEFLQGYKDREIIYVPNPGNAGDSMIAYGTFQVFDSMNLNWRIVKREKHNDCYYWPRFKDKLLFYGGGGNLVGGLYGACKNFLLSNKGRNEIVVLPHTVANEDSFIKGLDKNVKIICREEISYKYVRELMSHKENALLSDDMALHIKGIEEYKNKEGEGILNCFRKAKDKEASGIKIPADNVDVSSRLKFKSWEHDQKSPQDDVDIMKQVSLSVFDYLSRFSVINTNRAHMAIGGSLLNREVNMFSNSYYKNRAIYDYSLKGNYPNTRYES